MSDIFAGPHFLVAPDGTHCYPLAQVRWVREIVTPDGFRQVASKLGSGYSDPTVVWLIGPRALDAVEQAPAPVKRCSGYVLKDSAAASEKFPATLTPGQWSELDYDDEDSGPDAYMASRLYEAVMEDVPVAPIFHSTSVLTRLDGSPDPAPSRRWVADQPLSLVYSPAYHHLFPGRMPGFKDALLDALIEEFGKAVELFADSGVKEWTIHDKQGISVYLQIPYETPRWTTKEVPGRGRRKATVKVQQMKKVELFIRPGEYVSGPSKAEAAETFERSIREWIEWAKSYRLVACDHCSGVGTVEVQDERPTGVAS